MAQEKTMITRRRSFLKAASCLPLSLALPSIAYTKIDFGTAKITTISDGSITLPAGLTFDAMPQPELEPIINEFSLSRNQLVRECNVTLLETDTRKILFDVGAGVYFLEGMGAILDSLDEKGLVPEDITDVTKEILPGQRIDCIAYGCTSGTVAAGFDTIKNKVNLAKPEAKVTTPITSAIKAFKKFNISKISIFAPYTKEINDSIISYFEKENININSLSYFDIASDIDIGKVDQDNLFDVLSKMNLENSDALFVSCTALPVLSIIDKLEKILNKTVLSSNQTLIWDSLNQIGYKEKIKGFGRLLNN